MSSKFQMASVSSNLAAADAVTQMNSGRVESSSRYTGLSRIGFGLGLTGASSNQITSGTGNNENATTSAATTTTPMTTTATVLSDIPNFMRNSSLPGSMLPVGSSHLYLASAAQALTSRQPGSTIASALPSTTSTAASHSITNFTTAVPTVSSSAILPTQGKPVSATTNVSTAASTAFGTFIPPSMTTMRRQSMPLLEIPASRTNVGPVSATTLQPGYIPDKQRTATLSSEARKSDDSPKPSSADVQSPAGNTQGTNEQGEPLNVPVQDPESSPPSPTSQTQALAPAGQAQQSHSPSSQNLGSTASVGLDAYEVMETIGEGNFGRVKKVRRKCDGEILVWKELCFGSMSDREKQQLVAEVNILRDFNHRNIVKYFDRIIDKANKRIYILMEHCPGGDLGAFIKRLIAEGRRADEDFVWKILSELAQALYECHRKPGGAVLHRDLKPGNVFLDANGTAKLGDFGLARVLDARGHGFADTHVGTPYYMSPELASEAKYNEKSDIWALGCLIYELCALTPPFKASTPMSLAMKIMQGKYPPLPSYYSQELEQAIRGMLQLDQRKRFSVENILTLPRVQAIRLENRRVELRKRAEDLDEREKRLSRFEDELETKRQELMQLQKSLEEERARLSQREAHVAEREAELSTRERQIEDRERELFAKQINSHQLSISEIGHSSRMSFTHHSSHSLPTVHEFLTPKRVADSAAEATSSDLKSPTSSDPRSTVSADCTPPGPSSSYRILKHTSGSFSAKSNVSAESKPTLKDSPPEGYQHFPSGSVTDSAERNRRDGTPAFGRLQSLASLRRTSWGELFEKVSPHTNRGREPVSGDDHTTESPRGKLGIDPSHPVSRLQAVSSHYSRAAQTLFDEVRGRGTLSKSEVVTDDVRSHTITTLTKGEWMGACPESTQVQPPSL